MDCQSVQHLFLESLLEPLPEPECEALDRHLTTCAACRQFVALQQMLDSRLPNAIPAGSLSPWFRQALKARICSGPENPWSDWLPDVADVAGCALATLVVATLLPQHIREVLLGGAAFTGITWFLQTFLRGPFEAID